MPATYLQTLVTFLLCNRSAMLRFKVCGEAGNASRPASAHHLRKSRKSQAYPRSVMRDICACCSLSTSACRRSRSGGVRLTPHCAAQSLALPAYLVPGSVRYGAFADLDRECQFRGCVPFQMKRHGGGRLHAPAVDDGNSHGPCERAISAVFERDRQPERRARAIQRDGSAGSVIADGGVQDADGKRTRRIDGWVVGANGRKERDHTKEPAADHTSQISYSDPIPLQPGCARY